MDGTLRRIDHNKGAGLLEAIEERFEQLAHRHKGIVIKPTFRTEGLILVNFFWL